MFCRAISFWFQDWRLVSAIQAKIQSNDDKGALMYAAKIPEFFYRCVPVGISLLLVQLNLTLERYERAHKLLCSIRSVLSMSVEPVPNYLNEAVIIFTWEVSLYLHMKDENQTYATILKQMIRSKSLSSNMTGYFLTALDKAHMNGYLPTVDLEEWGISQASEMFLDNFDTNEPMMLLQKGRSHALNHQHKEAIDCFEHYLTELELLQGQGTSSVSIWTHLSIAKSYSKMNLFDRSIDTVKKALIFDFLHHGKDNTVDRAAISMSLGNDYLGLLNFDWAEKAYRTSLSIFIEIGNRSCPSTCYLYKMLHFVYLHQNDPVTAELFRRKQVALEQKLGVKVP